MHPPLAEGPSPSPVNILLVDDEPANLLALESLLAGPGLNLVKARSGEEALRHLHETDFAVVLLDLWMPGLDGFETAKLIRARKRTRAIPIIFLTAHDPAAFPAEGAYELGAVDYLVKPVVPTFLRAKVEVFVELARKTERLREVERRERARAEAALRQAEDRYRLIVQSAIDYAIFTTDLEGRVMSWNPGAERMFGYADTEMTGRDARLLFTPEDRRKEEADREMQLALAHGRAEDERWHLRKDGSRFWASGDLVPLRDPVGRVSGYLKILRDLTERKQAEEALKEADRRKDEFLAMLAHELRNPLAPIRNALEIVRLRGPERRDAARQAWEMIQRQVAHLVRLVDDLLDVSRITRGKIHLRKEVVDLAAVIGQAVETSRPLIEARRHQLEVSLPEPSVQVEADTTRLAQVVLNLLNNAAKYTEEGGRILLAVTTEGDEVVIRVRDSGVGIAAEMLPQVFDLFAQADHSLDRAQGGLGIGLTLVRRLVELHGGRVEAHSEGPGQGSEFIVRLPALPPREPATAPEAPSEVAPASPPSVRRILVVDDNVDAADSLATLLRLLGHQVRVVHDAPTVLAEVAAYRPDTVLLDIGLPGMDGYQLAKSLRGQVEGRGLLLMAMTGYGQEEDRRRSHAAGFDHHLVKPVDPQVLQGLLALPVGPAPSD